MLYVISNEVAYLLYFFGLLVVVGFAIHRKVRVQPGIRADVRRGDRSLNMFDAFFGGITVINLGVAHVTIPLMPDRTSRFAFLMLVIETFAWAYLIYRDAKTREYILWLREWTTVD